MALNFAQIGSGNNIQNVGEGTAYIVDKSKSPLLALGETALKSRIANDKVKAKEASAGLGKTELIKFPESGAMFAPHALDAVDVAQSSYSKAKTLEENNIVGKMANKIGSLAGGSKDINQKYDNADLEAKKMIANGTLDEELYKKMKNDIFIKGEEIRKSSPDKISAWENSLNYFQNNDPYELISKATIISPSELDRRANSIGQTVSQVVIPGESGFTTKLKKESVFNDIKQLVNEGALEPLVQRKYLSDLRTIASKNKQSLIKYSEPLRNPSDLLDPNNIIFDNADGTKSIVNKEKFIKDQYEKALIARLDKTDKDSYIQKWQNINAWDFGGKGDPSSKFQLSPLESLDVTGTARSSNENSKEGITLNSVARGGFTINSTDGKSQISVPIFSQNITKHIARGGNNNQAEFLTNGKSTIDAVSSGFVANGVTGNAFMLDNNQESTVDNYVKKIQGLIDNGSLSIDNLHSMKVAPIAYGQITNKNGIDTDYNKYLGFENGDFTKRQKATENAVSFPLNNKQLDAINSATGRNITDNLITNTQEAIIQKKALELLKKNNPKTNTPTSKNKGVIKIPAAGSGIITNKKPR